MTTTGVYAPPTNTFYTQIDLPAYITPAIFIGRDGCYFKKITDHSQSSYIWYDQSRGVIEVWGAHQSLQPALRLLRQRMAKFQDAKTLYAWWCASANKQLALTEFEKQ